MRGQWVITLTLAFFGFALNFHPNYLAESSRTYFTVEGRRWNKRSYARLAFQDKTTIDELAQHCAHYSGRPASFRSEQDEKNIAEVAAKSGLPALLTGIERSYDDPNMFVDTEGNKMDPKDWLAEPTYNVNEICVEYVLQSVGFKWRTTDCYGYGMICETVRKEFVEIHDTIPRGIYFWDEKCQKLGGQLAKIKDLEEASDAGLVANKSSIYMTGVLLSPPSRASELSSLRFRTLDDEELDFNLLTLLSFYSYPAFEEAYYLYVFDGSTDRFQIQNFNFETTLALCEFMRFS